MTLARDKAARYSRLAKGAYSQMVFGAGNQVVILTLNARCVAFNVAVTDDVRMRTDGVSPTASVGWPILAGAQLGWVDSVEGLELRVWSTTVQTIDVMQLLDEDPS